MKSVIAVIGSVCTILLVALGLYYGFSGEYAHGAYLFSLVAACEVLKRD